VCCYCPSDAFCFILKKRKLLGDYVVVVAAGGVVDVLFDAFIKISLPSTSNQIAYFKIN